MDIRGFSRPAAAFDFQKLLITLSPMIWKFPGCLLFAAALTVNTQTATPQIASGRSEKIQAISPATHPLPPESESWEVTQFSFIVYGDTRGRRDGKEIQYEHSMVVDSMIENIRKRDTTLFPIRFIMQTGDAVVDGGDARQWNKSFVGLINRLTTEGGLPYFLAPGNHDVTDARALTSTNRQQGLRNYLAAVGNLIPPDGAPRRLDGYPCFAFGYGNSFFIALDSNIAFDKTQLKWLVGQLEALDRERYPNVFTFFHHPVFSSGPHGGSTVEAPTSELRKRFMPLFRKHHVTAIFAGHEHLFEHWVERYQDKAGHDFRIDQVVTGGGGAPLYGHSGEPNLADYVKAGKPEKVQVKHLVRPGPRSGDTPYHYVIVQVDGNQIRLEVIGVDWGKDFRPYQSRKMEF